MINARVSVRTSGIRGNLQIIGTAEMANERTVTMNKLKCVECPYSEYDEYFKELWCKRKSKEVNENDTCDKSEDGER